MSNDHNNHGVVVEEIEGLIKVYKDGHVERPPIVPNVPSTVFPESGVVCRDVVIDGFQNVWARVYVPKSQGQKMPLLVYFHGGGFCVGSAAWSAYHDFLTELAAKSGCVIMSVNYRLAPENRLPSAYDDGFKVLMWVKQQGGNSSNDQRWWSSHCNFSKVFLAGDSAGANVAHNVAIRFGIHPNIVSPLSLKGTILIQPFFGGEGRTHSEKYLAQPPNSALTTTSSDVYWRLSLPLDANRDHPYCNPLSKSAPRLEDLKFPPTMVCISDLDIMKDRNLEFCSAMNKAGKKVEYFVYNGVGHAFQILHNYKLSQPRTQELMSHIKGFIAR
ncbi:hypothetical protein ACHQM5_009427 [Ranunculus cassubicifolius]